MQRPFLFRNIEALVPVRAPEKRGAVYTKPSITELILNMAGYEQGADLVAKFAVEPAAGEGAFLVPISVRLIQSARSKGWEPLECQDSLLAYELDQGSAEVARATVSRDLIEEGGPDVQANTLAKGWMWVGDYLTEATALPRAAFVVGDPLLSSSRRRESQSETISTIAPKRRLVRQPICE